MKYVHIEKGDNMFSLISRHQSQLNCIFVSNSNFYIGSWYSYAMIKSMCLLIMKKYNLIIDLDKLNMSKQKFVEIRLGPNYLALKEKSLYIC